MPGAEHDSDGMPNTYKWEGLVIEAQITDRIVLFPNSIMSRSQGREQLRRMIISSAQGLSIVVR